MLMEIETNDGVIGWATSGYTHPVTVDLVGKFIAPRIIGEDPFRTDRIPLLFDRHTFERPLGRAFVAAMAMVDIALWDIKGKTLRQAGASSARRRARPGAGLCHPRRRL